MFFALYADDGTILKAIEGPTLEWAAQFAADLNCHVIEAGHAVNDRSERVDVTVDPPRVVPAVIDPTPDEMKIDILRAAQRRLDDFAQTRSYDGIMSAATYTASTNPQFAAEAAYAVQIRDETWTRLYELLAEVESGARPVPAGYADIEPLLPTPTWPEEI